MTKKRFHTIIISDVHLGTKDCKAEQLLAFLHTHKADVYILNGDIVDGWALERHGSLTPLQLKVMARLLKLARKRQVYWLRGNHDEFLAHFLPLRLGRMQVVEHMLYRRPGSHETYLVMHGDQLDVFMTRWKPLAKIGAIGYDYALWLNTQYNRYRRWRNLPYFSLSKMLKSRVKSAASFIGDFETHAADAARRHGAVGIICGHIHKAENRYIGDIHYVNSGDWVESLTAVLVSHDGTMTLYEHPTQ